MLPQQFIKNDGERSECETDEMDSLNDWWGNEDTSLCHTQSGLTEQWGSRSFKEERFHRMKTGVISTAVNDAVLQLWCGAENR